MPTQQNDLPYNADDKSRRKDDVFISDKWSVGSVKCESVTQSCAQRLQVI